MFVKQGPTALSVLVYGERAGGEDDKEEEEEGQT